MNYNNELPSLKVAGSVSFASGFPRTITQNSFVFSDGLSFVHGAHTLRLGGSITRFQDNIDIVGLGSFVQFLSWPDFLLGLNAESNGTEFSNIFASFDEALELALGTAERGSYPVLDKRTRILHFQRRYLSNGPAKEAAFNFALNCTTH